VEDLNTGKDTVLDLNTMRTKITTKEFLKMMKKMVLGPFVILLAIYNGGKIIKKSKFKQIF